ncbi:hypothetical protein WMO40_20735 [Bacillaceae bacterium CLA-AA-H227]|uniref:Uncharacterized protein n=1 Tax=Robertmurraya yapensis (ex Hitch et al 2024) TaxID=3133160 RepID=A0ACC6SGL7_9BACI
MSSEQSFWGNIESEVLKENNNGKILFSKNIEELEKEALQAKEHLDYLEIVKARQHQILLNIENEYIKYCDARQYSEYEDMLKRIGHMQIELSSELENQILKIRLDYLLPIYHKTKNIKIPYYRALQEVYENPIIQKIYREQYRIPNFLNEEKVFVLIVQYFSNNKITDLDNRFHSFIFNALRSCRIISEDSWSKLSYMEDGRKTDEKPHTEIFVGSYYNLSKIIEYSYKV